MLIFYRGGGSQAAYGHNGRCSVESCVAQHLYQPVRTFNGAQSLIGGQPREARKNSYKSNNGLGGQMNKETESVMRGQNILLLLSGGKA